LPAEGWFHGLWELEWQERAGHPTYLLGAWSEHGSAWYYYVVGLLAKTPLAELLLVGGGAVVAFRGEPRSRAARLLAPLAAAAVLLCVVSLGHVQIGVRHVLPVFLLGAIPAGRALAGLVRDVQGTTAARIAGRCVAAALAGWLLVQSHAAHPEYIAYFNEAIGDAGDRVLLDSDLDWGQDLWRLEGVLRRLGVERVHLAYFGPAVPDRHALPDVLPLERGTPVDGWIAISAMYRQSPGFEWLARLTPVARAGKSIDVYFVPPSVGGAGESR
jgi:hypothetical protein